MDFFPIGLGIMVFFYLLAVLWYAVSIRQQPQPYPKQVRIRMIHQLQLMRRSLFFSGFILAAHSVFFLLPALFSSGTTRSWASLFGLTNLVYAVLLWGIWTWNKRLISTVENA